MVSAMADTINSTKCKALLIKEEQRPLLKDVNHCLICILCGGYLVDATTIIECLHTYCRSCIVNFLQTSKFCPICDVQVHRTKPYLSLRYDATMQKLVYKAVPGLYKNELLRRKSYLKEAEGSNDVNDEGVLGDDYYFAPDEPISLSLEYLDNKIDGPQIDGLVKSSETNEKEQITYKRYLSCPARLKIRHIYKFIKVKYSLKKDQEVEISYDNNKLPGSFSLMDVAYTFSWKRETPMRLCYQILESKIIQVPQTVKDKMSDKSVPLKNNFVTNLSAQNNVNNAVQNSNEVHSETNHSENSSTKVNLKRKTETDEITSNSEEREGNSKSKKEEKSEPEKMEPSVKIPRIEPSVNIPRISSSTLKDIMEKKDSHEEKTKPTATVSPCTENGLKLQVKPIVNDDFVDDFIKYEQDIEEVEDDDEEDEDDDRLRISQLSEDEKGEDNDQQLVIDTSDFENKDERKDENANEGISKKSAKYKRKSKKSKHSHHHKHHRHHERKKQSTPQATILHSPDTDIMKLKLKLNNVKPDVKYHKQRRKRKKSSECYFSSSFSSSSSVSSVSGMSPDTHTTRVDDDSLHSQMSELSAESVDVNPPKEEPPAAKCVKTEEPTEKYRSPNKEKLLQMRAFRPKNIAVVKPEENHKLEKHTEKTKNDNNNNDSITIVESKDKPKPVTPILRPPSSITMSKITAAEKQKMEKEKLMMMNGNKDDISSLEIMLVNGPPSSKSLMSPVSSTTDVTIKPKTPPRQIRPPPAAIPLVQYHKMKSYEQNLPKSLTITPQIQRSKSNEIKKVKDTLSIRDNVKRTVTVSLSGNPFENDFTGALDLSGKSTKYSDMINVPHTLLNKKLVNGVRPNGMSNYSPVKCMSSLASANNIRQFHRMANAEMKKYPLPPHKPKITISTPQTSPKIIPSRSINPKSGKSKVPNLNEIKIGPVSSTSDVPPKPGPNQTVRHIPNPSIMLQRHHQATMNNMNTINSSDYLPIKLPNSTSIMNHRISSNTCSLSTLKKSDKCPPAIPLKGYLDVTSIMATK